MSEVFIEDGNILWTPMVKQGSPSAWESGKEYKIGDVVVPTNVQSGQENLMFMCVGFIGKTGTSQPAVLPTSAGNTVTDGELKLVSRLSSADPVTLPYNEYYLITESLSVVSG